MNEMMPLGYDIHNILFFFGAGASAPFGIPTMKQFVDDFERFLSDNSSREEISFYKKVKDTLNSQLNRDIDLEDVFTVIDGYINFNFEKLGVLALYIFSELSKPRSKSPDYIEKDSKICESLRDKYRKFVKDKCLIPDQSFGKISNVYKDFFNRLFLESTSPRSYVDYQKGGYCYSTNWTIFTTNYDTCLEYYFREVAGAHVNTGFVPDVASQKYVMDALTLFNEPAAIIRLIKLHGSVNWLIDSEGTVSEESVLGQSFFGRKIVGEMMIYPVQQKDLYLEPYISMYKLLNNKLSEKLIWIIIGYSFNDPIIREIFVRNSRADKIMVFVHPDALRIAVERLKGLKNDVRLLNEWFGQDGHYRKVNYDIISKLISNPRFDAEETPVSQK